MSSSFAWPLSVSTFTLRDKLAIAWWLLRNDRYTMGAKTEELERRFSEWSGMYALCLSSGSAANQLVFELWKLKNPTVQSSNVVVIAPAVTWISAVSPAIHAGFDVRFCDVNLTDLSFDYVKLERMLKRVPKHSRIIIWPTALIGFCPDMVRLRALAKQYNADLYMDSCENTLSRIDSPWAGGPTSILASCEMTTTSCYFSHQCVMVEGGFAFFRNRADYELGKLFRNHGLIRSLGPSNPTAYEYAMRDPSIDPQFCFAVPGTNLRPTDVHAMFGLRDFARIDSSLAHRNRIYAHYHKRITGSELGGWVTWSKPGNCGGRSDSGYYLPPLTPSHSGFCLPIFTKGDNLEAIKTALRAASIEVRPLVGSCLLRQPALAGYGDPKDFPNAEWIHRHACYIGLHRDVIEADIDRLVDLLISLA